MVRNILPASNTLPATQEQSQGSSIHGGGGRGSGKWEEGRFQIAHAYILSLIEIEYFCFWCLIESF